MSLIADIPQTAFAWLFAFAALAVAGLHLLLILGAPIGFMTMGGRHQGVLPTSSRFASLFQGLLILFCAAIVLKSAGLIDTSVVPDGGWWLWLIVGISAASLVANTITHERRERLFGMPATLALLIGSLGVALGE